jgi:hypothetical protein
MQVWRRNFWSDFWSDFRAQAVSDDGLIDELRQMMIQAVDFSESARVSARRALPQR